MGGISKGFSLLLVVILAGSNLIIVESASAQTIPKLSTPGFTLRIVDYVVGGGLEIVISNQYVIDNGHDYPLIFFDFRYKWHESTNWIHPEPDPTKNGQYIIETGTTGVTRTIVPLNSYYEILGSSNSHLLDMQIRAINGYSNFTAPFVAPIPYIIDPNDYPVIAVNTSDWSNTHTITIPETSTSTSPTPNPTPTVPEFSWLMILPLFIFTLSVALLVRLKKTWKVTLN